MTLSLRGREALVMGLLAVLPVLAHGPALAERRLLGPGDGAALHYPLKAAVWEAYRERGGLPAWNPWIFCGTPLLAAYRHGAFYPPVVLAAWLPRFVAFQTLVVASLTLTALLLFLYLRRLGAGLVGGYVGGLCFALGPYLVGHLGDTATVVAAPMLPLVLLATEAYVRKGSAGRIAGLAAALALLLLAGSPEAARAGGALLVGRLLVGHFFPPRGRRLSVVTTALAVGAGVLLAAPQLLPTLIAARDAGRQVTGLADRGGALPGITGLILRYVSHTPAPSLALAALPLVLTETPIRVLGVAMALCLGLQWGRGPLSAPSALALVFDLTLAILAGLSLSAQWEVRGEALGRRLRTYLLFSCLASAAALSISAAALGPLPQTLAGAVGILALALILYFSLAASPDPVQAGLWLLPLTVSFLLQPHGRGAWEGAPTQAELETGTATRAAIDRALGARRAERILTLTRAWPQEQVGDLAYGNLPILLGRRSATGYDPMVPLRMRIALDGASVGGMLPGAFFRSDPGRLEALGVRWVQIPSTALAAEAELAGLGETIDLRLEVGRPRFLPLPPTSATEIRIASLMSDAVGIPQDHAVARVLVRLASGRGLELPIRVGRDTGEWAYDRPDVRREVAHERPPILETWRDRGGFDGHLYLGTLKLPGRYNIDGLTLERLPSGGQLTISRLAVGDGPTGRTTPVSLVAAYVSDGTRFREVAGTPGVRLFELPASASRARVVERVRPLADDGAVLHALRNGLFDVRREVLAVAKEAAGLELPRETRASRAQIARSDGGRLDVQAEGPGLLVLTEGWDPGWSALLDDAATRIIRVNHVQMGIVLPPGFHTVLLRYRVRGLLPGIALAALGGVLLALNARRKRS